MKFDNKLSRLVFLSEDAFSTFEETVLSLFHLPPVCIIFYFPCYCFFNNINFFLLFLLNTEKGKGKIKLTIPPGDNYY